MGRLPLRWFIGIGATRDPATVVGECTPVAGWGGLNEPQGFLSYVFSISIRRLGQGYCSKMFPVKKKNYDSI